MGKPVHSRQNGDEEVPNRQLQFGVVANHLTGRTHANVCGQVCRSSRMLLMELVRMRAGLRGAIPLFYRVFAEKGCGGFLVTY